MVCKLLIVYNDDQVKLSALLKLQDLLHSYNWDNSLMSDFYNRHKPTLIFWFFSKLFILL